jgi:hypothetical protein
VVKFSVRVRDRYRISPRVTAPGSARVKVRVMVCLRVSLFSLNLFLGLGLWLS